MKTIIERIGDFVHNLSYEPLSEEITEMAKLSILHHLYTGFCGIKEADSQIGFAYVMENLHGPGICTLIGHRERTSLLGAGFLNAVYMHGVQQEDTLRGLHPGPHTIPPALAIGERDDGDGKRLITSMIAGYEVNLKIGEFCAKYSGPRGWRGTTIYGVLGATATAAKMLELDKKQIMNAIALSTNFAAGLMQCWLRGTPEWLYTSGLAAQNGITSAMLAKSGCTGAQDSFEGDRGFYNAYCGVVPKDADDVIQTLGKDFSILDIVLKPYSVITSILPVIHNVVLLATQDDIKYEDVKSIRITAGPKVTEGPLSKSVLDTGPFLNKTQAYKSIPCATGIALKHREVTPISVDDFRDKSIADIAERVTIETNTKYENYFSQVEITMNDGSVSSIEGEEFPTLDSKKVRQNFINASSPLLGRGRAEKAADAILSIERRTIRDVLNLLYPADTD
jgi:2-methylcitrate dehydratase PrpD